MEKLKRSFSFRKKKDHVPECSKPHQWQEDERKVRDGTCSFQVRYLGCIEVFESRGIQICEEAVKALKAKKSRSVWSRMSLRKKKKKAKDDQQCKGKYQRAILYVSGDALRVVDEISKGLIVDQTIEKVSFCAPDRNHEKGFAYICRDGTTRRWMCHGFLALKESGERLSHAVGCAFAICLEKKQKREKESVTVTFNEKGTSFTRTGSFRHTTLTERLADPQSAIIAEPVPSGAVHNINAVQRPHATQDMLIRQGSFRGFTKLNESSPFKRQLSLRLNDLPSTLERQQEITNNGFQNPSGPGKVSPIPEASPTKEQSDDTIAEMCQQLSQGLSALTSQDPFSQAPGVQQAQPHQAANYVNTPHSTAYSTHGQQSSNIPDLGVAPIQQINPWAPPPQGASKVSDAEFWLHSTASSINQSPQVSHTHSAHPLATTAMMNGAVQQPFGAAQSPLGHQATRAPQLSHLRSQSLDTAESYTRPTGQRAPMLHELSSRNPVAFQSVTNGTTSARGTWNGAGSVPTTGGIDPFDAAWAAKAVNKNNNTNPFQKHDTVTKTFEANV